MEEIEGMSPAKLDRFDASMLSNRYAEKSSLARYKELHSAFPNVLIIFEHGGCYYGFNETAVALYFLFGCRYYRQKGMLVVKVEKAKFEEHMIGRRQMRGFRYLVDRNGRLTFEKGIKKFRLRKPLSYYEANLDHVQNNSSTASSYRKAPDTRHGGGWHDDVWAPGLPSSRFFRKKSKS